MSRDLDKNKFLFKYLSTKISKFPQWNDKSQLILPLVFQTQPLDMDSRLPMMALVSFLLLFQNEMYQQISITILLQELHRLTMLPIMQI